MLWIKLKCKQKHDISKPCLLYFYAMRHAQLSISCRDRSRIQIGQRQYDINAENSENQTNLKIFNDELFNFT